MANVRGIGLNLPALLRHDQTHPCRHVLMSTAIGVGLILTYKFIRFNCKSPRLKSTQQRELQLGI